MWGIWRMEDGEGFMSFWVLGFSTEVVAEQSWRITIVGAESRSAALLVVGCDPGPNPGCYFLLHPIKGLLFF
ncbi:unnamed protein product [Linum trigynum]|uniref:Uncharacterized protein n=1 Tax=Linum trigynum TaxID=586398 RepID=A0AAV2EVR5_9ROSI